MIDTEGLANISLLVRALISEVVSTFSGLSCYFAFHA